MKIVADAKYIALDGSNSYQDEEKATAIYYKTITYMYRWNAKIGLLLYPISNNHSIKTSEHHILGTDGCVVKVGFPIPICQSTFSEFSDMMRINEDSYLEHCRKYTIRSDCDRY